MASKEFKATSGFANWETSQNVITAAITSNSATTVDTVALNSFYSIRYDISIVQGSKTRSSKVTVQTDGTSVDSTEYGIVATGGAISGVAITATASAGNMLLQVTVTDAATTIARVRAVKNLVGVIQPYLPGAPTIGTATVATGQSYTGNANASISFTAPADNGNSAITSYTVTSSSGNSVSGASSPLTVSELVGIARTYTVTANNSIGSSTASSASNSVTPSSVPQAPTIGTVTATQGAVSVPFTANATGGSAITSYTATSTSGVTATGASSPIALTETVSGTYTYTVRATNTNGNSVASSASNSVTISLIARAGFIAHVSSNTSGNKMVFSNETVSSVANITTTNRYATAGMANSGTAGYLAGGQDNFGSYGRSSVVDKFNFANDSSAALGTGLLVGASYQVGFANSGTAGYFAGGIEDVPSAGTTSNRITKFTFSNDSRSMPSATLAVAKQYAAAFANSGTAGYILGGMNSGGSFTSSIDKLTFSNDSRSTLAATLSANNGNNSGMANSGVAGYLCGGVPGSYVAASTDRIEKVTFSNDSRSTISAVLASRNGNIGSFANSGTAGYMAGGTNNTPTTLNSIQKLTFSDESRSTISATLTAASNPTNSCFANSAGL